MVILVTRWAVLSRKSVRKRSDSIFELTSSFIALWQVALRRLQGKARLRVTLRVDAHVLKKARRNASVRSTLV